MPHPFPLGLEGTGKTKIRAMTHDDDKNEASNRAATTKQNTTEFSDLLDECPLQPMKIPLSPKTVSRSRPRENFPVELPKISRFCPRRFSRSTHKKFPVRPWENVPVRPNKNSPFAVRISRFQPEFPVTAPGGPPAAALGFLLPPRPPPPPAGWRRRPGPPLRARRRGRGAQQRSAGPRRGARKRAPRRRSSAASGTSGIEAAAPRSWARHLRRRLALLRPAQPAAAFVASPGPLRVPRAILETNFGRLLVPEGLRAARTLSRRALQRGWRGFGPSPRPRRPALTRLRAPPRTTCWPSRVHPLSARIPRETSEVQVWRAVLRRRGRGGQLGQPRRNRRRPRWSFVPLPPSACVQLRSTRPP